MTAGIMARLDISAEASKANQSCYLHRTTKRSSCFVARNLNSDRAVTCALCVGNAGEGFGTLSHKELQMAHEIPLWKRLVRHLPASPRLPVI